MKQHNGFLTLVTVAIIVIVGFLGVAVTYMFYSSALSNINYLQGSKAFYIAEGGLEQATRALETPFLSGAAIRIACTAISGNANLTNTTLGEGKFTVTGSGPSYVSSPTTLTATLNISDTSATVTSTSGYQSSGRIMIDKELLNYTSTDSTHFLGLTHGVSGTTASSHASGMRVGQYQCQLTSNGGVPNLTSPLNKHTLQDNVQLQEAWVVGNTSGGNPLMARWNRPTELNWTNASGVGTVNLNSVSMSSYADGWAVGASNTFLRWGGSAWSTVATGMTTTTWNTVYCYAGNMCVAGGNSNGSNPGLAYWNGTSWTQMTPSGSSTSTTIESVHCDASNDCWAVGSRNAAVKIFYNWNGSSWAGTDVSAAFPTNASFPFNGVFCTTSTDCWAVGSNNIFARKSGASWSAITTALPSAVYNSVFCNKTDDCWAVGNNNSGRDLIAHWDGSSWTRDSSNPTPVRSLLAVACSGPDDCWAVGTTASGGFVHYDGTSWTTFTTLSGSTTLNGISRIYQGTQPRAAWIESFP